MPAAGGPAARTEGRSSPAALLAPGTAAGIVLEAVGADPTLSLLGRRGPLVAWAALGAYVGLALGLPSLHVADALALVPLVLAALSLGARPAAAAAGITLVVAFASLTIGGRPPGAAELIELGLFAAVGLALRLVAIRLTRGIGEIERVAAELAVMRLQVDEAREATERWVGQLDMAQRAAARMAARATFREVAEAVADEIGAIVDYHACRVYVLEEPDSLFPVVATGSHGYEEIALDLVRVRVGEGFAGWVAANGRPLLIPDTTADPRGVTIPGTDDVDESMIVVPMRYDDRVSGVIALSKLGLRQFDLADVRILSILADQAATALQSAAAIGASAALADDLRRITEMSTALTRSLDPQRVANVIAEHVGRAFDADECSISQWDRDGDCLRTRGYWPPSRLADFAQTWPLDAYPESRRVVEAQAIVVVDASDPAADPAEAALLRADGMRSLVMVPLIASGETVGLIELFGRQPLRLSDRHIDLVRTMGNEGAMALSNADLYERTRALADRDPLTGFFNHRFLHERLGEELLRAQRSGEPLALLMLDLDDFKLVNDTLGHQFGDAVLRWVAAQIREELRGSDVPARYGGDEFAVILPGTSAVGAREVGERIVGALRDRPYRADGRGPVPVGASVGVAAFPADGRTPSGLIAGADAALYRVKHGGGSGVDGRVRRRLAPRPTEPAPARRRATSPS